MWPENIKCIIKWVEGTESVCHCQTKYVVNATAVGGTGHMYSTRDRCTGRSDESEGRRSFGIAKIVGKDKLKSFGLIGETNSRPSFRPMNVLGTEKVKTRLWNWMVASSFENSTVSMLRILRVFREFEGSALKMHALYVTNKSASKRKCESTGTYDHICPFLVWQEQRDDSLHRNFWQDASSPQQIVIEGQLHCCQW